jgi:hypothetical protein
MGYKVEQMDFDVVGDLRGHQWHRCPVAPAWSAMHDKDLTCCGWPMLMFPTQTSSP